MLTHIRDALKPGGHLVLLDPKLIVDDLRSAGFVVLDRRDEFATNLGGTHFGLLVAKRP